MTFDAAAYSSVASYVASYSSKCNEYQTEPDASWVEYSPPAYNTQQPSISSSPCSTVDYSTQHTCTRQHIQYIYKQGISTGLAVSHFTSSVSG